MSNSRDLTLSRNSRRFSPYCDAPMDFITAGGYHLVSSLLGRFTVMPETPGNRPNPWFIIASIPSLMRRSTLLSYVNQVYREALREFLKATRPEEEGIDELVQLSILEEGTKEGLTDHIQLAYEEKGIDAFAI